MTNNVRSAVNMVTSAAETAAKTAVSGARLRGAALALLVLGLAACAQEGAQAPLAGLEVTTTSPHELVFSGSPGNVSEAQPVSFKNTGAAPLVLQMLSLGGPDAGAFRLASPKLPLVLAPGSSAEAAVSFSPPTTGTRRAALQVESSAGTAEGSRAVEIGLYGLGSRGDEPSLQQVVDTLGYRVEVGDTRAAGDTPVGDEVSAPFFERADEGPVTLNVVARYGPSQPLPYGMFTFSDGTPLTREVGQVAAKDTQELLPPRATGSTSFDPGTAAFGVYAQSGDDVRYSLDGLNPGGAHAVRVYPLHDRGGNPVSHSYLLSLEAGDTGRDYQDALFILGNVRLAGVSTAAPAASEGWEKLFNGHDLSGWYSYLPSKGKNNDPEGVFRAENGMIHILGVEDTGSRREFGYLATDKSYTNYHLRLEYRWGEKRFAPRDRSKRDSGVVYHVTGRDTVWPRGVEYQIQEGDTGDFWLLSGTTLTTTVASPRAKEPRFAENGLSYTSRSGRFVRIAKDETHERSGWNTVDILVEGDTVTHMINGQVNNRAYNLRTPGGGALDAGKILLQAEGAEVFYRNVQIRQLP